MLDSGEHLLAPNAFNDPEHEWVAIVSTIGKLLIYPVNELPVLTKGKGVKLMQLNYKSDIEEKIAFTTILKNEQSLRIYTSAKRPLILREEDQQVFVEVEREEVNFCRRAFEKSEKLNLHKGSG